MFDVLVAGGGPVGASLAALLARGAGAAGLSVALLEPRPPAAVDLAAPLDPRVVAISRASERILCAAGAWHAIAGPRICPYERMRIWHERASPAGPEALVFDAADVAEPNLGYIAENRLLQAALFASAAAAGVHMQSAPLERLTIREDAVEVATAAGTLRARLVVGADGAQSAVRAAAALAAESSDYHQQALVASIATARPHEATAYQRFMASGTLALLPLADGTSSIVWSADEELAQRLLSLGDAQFAAELDRASDLVLGETRLVSERQSFALRRLAAPRYIAARIALVGDAAHVVHPLAGQGVNLGLLDAATLAQLILAARARREDPGALGVLRAYERWRRSDVAMMSGAIEIFDRLLAHGGHPLARLAQRGLGLVGRSEALRRFFIYRALGLSGELPQAAR